MPRRLHEIEPCTDAELITHDEAAAETGIPASVIRDGVLANTIFGPIGSDTHVYRWSLTDWDWRKFAPRLKPQKKAGWVAQLAERVRLFFTRKVKALR